MLNTLLLFVSFLQDTRQKRKYVRRRDKIAGGLHCLSPPAMENAPPKPGDSLAK